MARRVGEDEICLRVFGEDEEPEIIEPASWDVTARGVDLSTKLDLLTLKASGNAPRVWHDIRIGPTWRSVVSRETRSDYRKK